MSDRPVTDPAAIDGYVTDIAYPRRYYRELNPASIAFAALQAGFAAPRLDQPFRYLDLGCGHGLSPALFAALFPAGDFIGIDFNPDHIASADMLRNAAGLENATFFATTFAEMLADRSVPAPDCDFIVMHGVMSWVSPAVQDEILALIERRLKPGGIVYVSYNCQPGWAAKIPLRELLMDAYRLAEGSSVAERLAKAKSLLHALADNGAHYIEANPSVRQLLTSLDEHEAGYLAHEFLNEHWTVFYHRDMAGKMRTAGLDYLGSATVADNIPFLALPEKQAVLMNAMPNAVMRETVRDTALNRQFRRDLYGRDLKPMSLPAYVSALKATSFVLAQKLETCSLTIKRSFGDIDLDAAVFKPLLDRLSERPVSFDALCALAPLNTWALADQAQAIQVLVGAGFARPIVAGAKNGADEARLIRFNAAATEIARSLGERDVALASRHLIDAVIQPLD